MDSHNQLGDVEKIYLVDPFTGMPLNYSLQTYPFHDQTIHNPNYNLTNPVFHYIDSNDFYMYPDDHDTWKYVNGVPDSHHSLFDDTFSATKIYRIDPINADEDPYCDFFYAQSSGLPYNVAMGVLPSIEFSFCPVLQLSRSNRTVNHCKGNQDYDIASFSFVPERIND